MTQLQKYELNITRLFDAPRKRVFNAWIEKQDVLQWQGPKSHPIVSSQSNVREGGAWHSILQDKITGEKLFYGGIYKTIKEPELLIMTFAWEDENGNPGLETTITIRFEEVDNKTKMHFHQAMLESTESRDSHGEGWISAFDRLDVLFK
jgi:uncharacterized protein YndB with AHSA1/START domain